MLNPSLLGHSRIRLFTFIASVWLILVSLLLLANYHNERDSVFTRLEFKSDSQAVQFERHWHSLYQEELDERVHYLTLLKQGFAPHVELTVIGSNGKIQATTLTGLNQLSYSPVIKQLQIAFDNGQFCLPQLMSLVEEKVNACGFFDEHTQTYLITSLHDDAFLDYWLDHSGYFIAAVVLGLLIFTILFYLLSIQQLNTQEKQHSLSLQYERQENDFKRLISNLPGLVYRIRVRDQNLDFVSSGSMQLLGYPPEHFTQNGITPFDLIDDGDQHDFKKQSHAAHFSLKPFELVYRMNTLQGERKWVLDRGRCYRDINGDHFIEGVILDITERELVRQQIEYLAVQDPLTELYNRYKFNDQLVSAVDEANQNNEHFAMLFIDLDRFKNINDSLGHQLGDRLLRKVASRLQTVIPEQHFLARMGGDEFVILMRDIQDENEVKSLASDINRTLRKPFNIDSYQLRTSCSIGISLCPQHDTHSHILWRYADTAMYQVKNRGGDGYQFFTNEMGDLVQHRITIEHGFIPALENKQFELHYQPQVNIHTGEVIGAEALLRWRHPDLGFISPAEFIPIAEETGFIHDLGDWIIKEALIQLSRWQQHNPNISLAVNVSAVQITEEFPEKIDALTRQFNLRPFSLELEITESLLMENIDFVLPLLNQICEKNIRFAIDDFGTGYSSLSYLRYLPIDKLKIDRAFVMNLEDSDDDVSLVRAIVAMAKNLNLKVLAEGIETQPQLAILQTLGCESYQGYYFSKPVDKDTFYSLYINTAANVQSQA